MKGVGWRRFYFFYKSPWLFCWLYELTMLQELCAYRALTVWCLLCAYLAYSQITLCGSLCTPIGLYLVSSLKPIISTNNQYYRYRRMKHLPEFLRPAQGQPTLGGPLGRCCDCNDCNTKTESIFGDSDSESTAGIKDSNEIRHRC